MKKCFAGNRPVLKNGEAKIYKDNLELVLQRHIHNLHNSSVNGMQAVINSAYIIENTLLKIREILETHSPETNGYYGWLMLRLPSQLKHIEEFLEFSDKVAWCEFHENTITERMFLVIESFDLEFTLPKEELIGQEINMNDLLKLIMKKKYEDINYYDGYIL